MSLELLKVAGRDHAGDFDAQCRKRVGCFAHGFDHCLCRHECLQVSFELFPAGDQLRRPTFYREVLHGHEVLFGTVRANENHLLRAGYQQLLFELPVVMSVKITRAHICGQLLVPHFMFEDDLAHHGAAVQRGQQVALGTDDRK